MKKAFVRYDNLQVTDSGVYQRLLDLDEYYNHFVPGWHFTAPTRFLDSKLKDLYKADYEWAVVSALGHFLRQGSVDDTLIDECIKTGATLAGHLLDRQGYYNIDPQFFCVNLKKWSELGFPSFAEESKRRNFQSVVVERSPENVHDDYTPLWLRQGEGKHFYQVDRVLFGSRVVQAFLEDNQLLINVPNELRNRKICLYPNHNLDELKSMFTDINYIPGSNELKVFIKKIKQEYDVQFNQVYVLNSEPVLLPPPIDHYFGVCGGLKAVAILHGNGFHENTTVDLFDISPEALAYQKYLVENWDGDFDNYYRVFKTYSDANPTLTYAWRNWNSWEHEVNVFLTSGQLTKEEFKETWQKYCKLNIVYTELNLLDDTQVSNYFSKYQRQPSKNYYVWISNAYRMEHTMVMNGKHYFIQKTDRLRSLLLNLSGTIQFESCNTLERIK